MKKCPLIICRALVLREAANRHSSLSPGEELPEFPHPTHAEDPPLSSGLRPFNTINSAIANIPDKWYDHDTSRLLANPRPPYSGDQLASCVMTAGSPTPHPSGVRMFTHREQAGIQTFPLCHKFGKKDVLKQIGNAVPPLVGKVILESVVATLRKTDEREELLERMARLW